MDEGPGEYDICPVCFWEDDGSGFLGNDTPSNVNQGLRLSEAQLNYATYGACHPSLIDMVRTPYPDEPVDENWRPWYLDKNEGC